MPPTYTRLDLNSMRKTGAFTDLVIECGGETFNVHKLVVCQQSDVLQTSCASLAKVGTAHCSKSVTVIDSSTLRGLALPYEMPFLTQLP